MAYFKRIKSFEDLKQQFRQLSKQHHPDITGGSDTTIKEINNEYDMLFPIWKKKSNITTTETASSTRSEFYTQNGWAGKQYDPKLSTKEIAANIRRYVKDVYPTWKFSVTSQYYSGGSSINISVMTAPYEIFDYDNDTTHQQKLKEDMNSGGVDMQLHTIRSREQMKFLNDFGYTVLKDVYDQLMSYRYDDSDGMIDYFDTNFYHSFNLGKWDKPFQVVEKTARVKSPNFEVSK